MSTYEHLTKRRIGVVGLGERTGVSLVKYLCSQGAHVVVYDQKTENELKDQLNALTEFNFEFELGTERPIRILSSEFLLLSPGVPFSKPFLVKAREKGIPTWSEVEFAGKRLSSPLLAITGTNGKSTTTSLLAHLLKTSGKKVFVGGNLGTPLIEALGQAYDFIVAEISSFQLEAVETFHPKVAALLNIFPNHLDRHGDMKTYVACKEKLFAKMEGEDLAILNQENSWCQNLAKKIKSSCWQFSLCSERADVYVKGEEVFAKGKSIASLKGYQLFGKHNLENALAALSMAFALGCSINSLEKGIQTFTALPHRLKWIATYQGVRFINDSKSTTPEAAICAIQSFDAPTIYIAGGRPKGFAFSDLARAAERSVKHAIFFGEAASQMGQAFNQIPHHLFRTLGEALEKAIEIAQDGDVVLFSPANSSFDQYKSYEHRGDHFRSLLESFGKDQT